MFSLLLQALTAVAQFSDSVYQDDRVDKTLPGVEVKQTNINELIDYFDSSDILGLSYSPVLENEDMTDTVLVHVLNEDWSSNRTLWYYQLKEGAQELRGYFRQPHVELSSDSDQSS